VKLGSFSKQPGETESYTISHEDSLTTGDYVLSAVATVLPTGVGALTLAPLIITTPRIRMFASGGIDGTSYVVQLVTRTGDGRVLEDEFTIKVKEI
jgi:hypothetical protein